MIKPSRRRGSPGPAPASSDTRARILDTAERLFAERGIEVVSVRSVLVAAGVNVALAHYHFGSREGLIAELIRTRVAPLVREQRRDLDAVDSRDDGATLEDVLRAYFAPAARWLVEQPRLGRLLAQLQTSASPDIQAIGRDALRGVITRLGEAVLKRLPRGLDPQQFFLRFYLVLGGPSFLAGNWGHIQQSARRHFGADTSLDAAWISDELVAFSAAGLRAAASSNERGRRERE